ncbi:FGGY carbohydrate kinase domain-containing protein-like [Agrilus planipennis]|uniref:FGGY carbohydrate kinase domain-containing protein-like n=1 Tax=Agrilus planipennis TaxID=224129 RepID=A0A7F5RMQ5_AGRPL|nr:FGGY carbohydrate kinase domain-containing protein-like [Agrilus planipennis]
MDYFIGVDVGTGSVRAALVAKNGKVAKAAVENLKTWNPQPDFYEQSSDDVWNCCKKVIKEVVKDIPINYVKGIGFDATCSLVVLNKDMKPLSASLEGTSEQNIILWMDHRAVKEANFINDLKHPVLRFVGGKVSLEMEIPKLLWLKTHLRQECWDQAGAFFDLPDFLTWKATGSIVLVL